MFTNYAKLPQLNLTTSGDATADDVTLVPVTMQAHHMVGVVSVDQATKANHKRHRVGDVGNGTVVEGQGGVEAHNVKGSNFSLPLCRIFRQPLLRENSEDARPEEGVAVVHPNGPAERVSFQGVEDATCSTPGFVRRRCTRLGLSTEDGEAELGAARQHS